jgi:ribosome biogenesis GTPase A
MQCFPGIVRKIRRKRGRLPYNVALFLPKRRISMSIQWFPGHMNAARKKAAETMENTDLVIEVQDARIPQASCNPMVESLRTFRQRPCLKILNKADLADPNATKAWLDFYNAQKGVFAVALSCKKPSDVAKVPGLALKLAPHRGVPTKPLRMMIMGIPNVGKSTLMNALLKKRVANVGDEPAVTKTQQRLYLGKNMILTDTPGMLWPKIEHPTDGLMLAASHAVGVNALIEEEIATFLAEQLLIHYPKFITARYGFPVEGIDAVSVIEGVAKKRGYKLKGGDWDYEKASHTLLLDYRSGALGRVSLETPASREHLLATYVPPVLLGQGKSVQTGMEPEQEDAE